MPTSVLMVGALMVGTILVGQISGAGRNLSEAGNDRYPPSNESGQNSLEIRTQSEAAPLPSRASDIYPSSPIADSMTKARPLPGSEASSREAARPDPTRQDRALGDAKPREGNPTALLQSLAKHSTSSQLTGLPLNLSDALAGADSRPTQSARVELYWKLATAVMQYDLSLRELTELSALERAILQPGQAWEEVRAAANATVQTKLQTARALQYRLQRELGRAGESTLPLPSDLPLCGAYQSRYDELFGNRQVPEAAALAKLLETEYSCLRQQAASVTTTREWLDAVSARRSSQSDGTELLQVYQSFASSRRLFLQEVKYYNDHIARYTELATPERVDTQRLVAMLIKTHSLIWSRDGINRTSAEQPAASGNPSPQPRTYAEQDRNESRRVPTLERKGEHSILVE
jgi:hypothetical protein